MHTQRGLKQSETSFTINVVKLFKELKEGIEFIMALEHFTIHKSRDK